MVKKLQILLLVLMVLPFVVFAEGSKQLTPNNSTAALTSTDNDKAGYLAHDANLPSASGVSITSLSFLKPAGFSRNGATYSKDHRLYIRVKAGETLYYGVHRAIHDQTTANQANLTITLRRTNAATGVDDASYSQANTLTANTNSTRDMLLVANQNGVIDNATEANNGPNRVAKGGYAAVTNGYTPLSITNNTGTDYDYYVEFTQAGETSWTDDSRRFSVYDFWDFTVIDGNGAERQGRMRSKLWSFSAGGTTNVFSKNFNMYPLVPSVDQSGKYFVKKVELAGIAPQNFFRFVTNQYGSTTGAGATIEERRKSQTSQLDYPELNNFVNNPDPEIWPSAVAPSYTVSIVNSCNTNTKGGKALFTLNTTESSTFLVLINLNGTEGYQPGTEDVLLESTGAKGIRTLEWNGLNGKGAVVASGTTINYFFRNNSAAVHFPVWDAEANISGFRTEDVRPIAGSNYNGLLFWDDANLPTTSFPAPQTELFGVVSTAGVHKWGSASTTAGDLKTVNTWTYGYTASSTQSSTFTYDCSADVAVTNIAATAPYAVGQPFTYTVTVTNNGPQVATNVQVTDKLDASKLQFVSASSSAYNSSTGVWTVGSMTVGTSQTLTITAIPLVTGTVATTATQTHTEADNVSTNNSATSTITVQPAADIQVTNAADKTTYNNGDITTYTITAKNLGPNAATGVTVSTNLPSGFVPYGTAPAGFDTSTNTWNVGSLGLNEVKTLTLQAQVTKTGSFTSTATLGSRTGYEVDANSSNNTSSTTVTVTPAADVAVTNVVSNAVPGQGDAITYTIKATNNGPNNATNVSVANQIPSGLTITGSSVSSGTFDASTGTWTVGQIVANGSQTLTITAKPTVTGSLTVTSTQTHSEYDRESTNNSASNTINVKATADVAVTNVITSAAKSTYANGDEVTYLVTVTNNGPSTATNVVIEDKWPAALTFVSASNSNGTGTYNTTDGTWSVGTLANGASATLTLVGKVNQSAVITTTAKQTHTEYDNTNGNNSASNSITSGTGIVTADVKVTIGMSAAPYYTGKQLTLGVRVDNEGPDAATGVSINSLIPAGFTLVSATPKVGTYDASTGVWTVGNLASKSYTGMNLVVKPNVDNTVTGDKSYTFAASKATENEYDSNASNNSASTEIVVRKAADASVQMTVTGDVNGVFYKGVTEATFTMTVTNNGPDKITNLVGYDSRIDPNTGRIQFTYAEPGKGYDATTGRWDIASLDPGQSISLTIKGYPLTTGRTNLGGSIASADQTDLNTENNKAVALLNVVPVANLEVTNTAAAGPYYNGENTTFTVTLKNNSTDAATGVKIEDVLPAGLTFVSSTASAGTYDASTGIWTLGTDVLAGTTETLVLTVKPTSGTTYSTTASVKAANEYDNNTANNTATAQIEVQKTADIALAASIVEGPYYVNGQYKFTITATNLGPDPATGVVVSARLASGLKTVTGSGTTDGGTINAATGTWSIGNIGVNETKTLTFLVVPTTTGTLSSRGYKSAENEFDPNGGTTQNGNNSTALTFNVQDREATYQVVTNNRYFYFLTNRERIATVTDPDGSITSAKIISGTLPAGLDLENNGELEVINKLAIRPGTHTLTIETTDEKGEVSQNTITFTFADDFDHGGISDTTDIDDNNDGIPDMIASGGADPFADADKDGQMNYYDRDFVHPLYGAFRDQNLDDINDWFDTDEDGIINSLDYDMDGDGITNVVEANGGNTNVKSYNPQTGMISGGVNQYGLPLAVQPAASKETTYEMPDTDGDDIPDFRDIDSDNDGTIDNYESQSTAGYINATGTDSDQDGIDNAYDPTCGCGSNGIGITPVNTDGTDLMDYRDINSDDDLYEDFIEAFDDNENGASLDDYLARGAYFEQINASGKYTTEDANNNGTPNWLERVKNTLAFLTKNSPYYLDANHDGLVDLFDRKLGGAAPSQNLVLVPGTTNTYEFAARTSSLATPLPVELISFTAKAEKGGVALVWATASEKNNDYFLVERSLDGKIFQSIGQVKGAGNSVIRVNYTYQDSQAPAGTVYYRLKQVDFDSKFEYSKIIAVEAKGSTPAVVNAKINLYPNPASAAMHVDLSTLSSGTVKATIFGMDGRIAQQLNLEGGVDQTVDVTKLPAGAYLIRLQGEGFNQTLRFIKE